MMFSFDHFCFNQPPNSEGYLTSLLAAMIDELNYVVPERFRDCYKDLQNQVREAVNSYDPNNEQTVDELFDLRDDVIVALNENAPLHLVFAMNSAGHWGWQIDEWSLERSQAEKVCNLLEVDDDYRGEVIVVNNRGDISLYIRDDEGFKKIWENVHGKWVDFNCLAM